VTHEARSYCRFCVAQCGVRITVDGDRIVNVKGDDDNPGSRGYTCPKGRSLGRWHHDERRISQPRMNVAGARRDTSWDDAFADVASRLRGIIAESGPDAVGAYLATASSFDAAGRWAADRFTRAIGSRSKYTATSIDTPCKPLVSLLMSGFPGLVPVLDDQACTLTMLVGSNPVVSHGHLNAFPDPVVRLRELAAAPRELWVVDPRTTETARLATRHLAPRPGTDFALFAHVARELLVGGGCDDAYVAAHAHADDLATLRDALFPWTVDLAAEVTGCAPQTLHELVATIRRHGRVSIQTGTGTTMSPVANLTEWLVWVVHILTGSYDTEGGMWFHPGFIRQLHTRLRPNAAAPAPSPGPRSRPEVSLWSDEFPCSTMLDEIESGNLRALIVFGGNPVSAFPNTERTRRALASLDALVVLDVVDTDTTALASHVLPCKGQLERADIPFFTDQFNLDFSTQYTDAVVAPIGDVRSMWWITARIADDLGTSVLPESLSVDSGDADVLAYIAARSAASFDDVRSVRYTTTQRTFGWVRERVLPEGRWRLAPGELLEQHSRWRELVPPAGLLATSQRQLRHLNSQHPSAIGDLRDDARAQIHPNAAAARGIAEGDAVLVRTPTGSVRMTASLNDSLHPDCVVLPHGWSTANVSNLTSETLVDSLTAMVTQTAFAVDVEPADVDRLATARVS
jgi:anaerobic selenocysteine-containing dehydrogenase